MSLVSCTKDYFWKTVFVLLSLACKKACLESETSDAKMNEGMVEGFFCWLFPEP